MVGVSLCMIVKNEEDVLNRCLESAAELVDAGGGALPAYLLFRVFYMIMESK